MNSLIRFLASTRCLLVGSVLAAVLVGPSPSWAESVSNHGVVYDQNGLCVIAYASIDWGFYGAQFTTWPGIRTFSSCSVSPLPARSMAPDRMAVRAVLWHLVDAENNQWEPIADTGYRIANENESLAGSWITIQFPNVYAGPGYYSVTSAAYAWVPNNWLESILSTVVAFKPSFSESTWKGGWVWSGQIFLPY